MSSRISLITLVLAALVSKPLSAGVMAERTRVIFEGSQRENSLVVVNQNKYPIIVQAWIDDGALASSPDDAKAPIMPLPPIFRLEPGQQRSLRLIYIGSTLPTQQESLYWLNLYEVPPRPTDPVPAEHTRLTITMRTQMKVFYRPEILVDGASLAHAQLTFKAIGTGVEIENGTPYYLTLVKAEVQHDDTIVRLKVDMMAPFSKQEVRSDQQLRAGDKVEFTWVDDDGILQNDANQLR